MRKLVDRHINTVLVGIPHVPHVQEVKGKTEQVCRDKEYIKGSILKSTIFEMTHTG